MTAAFGESSRSATPLISPSQAPRMVNKARPRYQNKIGWPTKRVGFFRVCTQATRPSTFGDSLGPVCRLISYRAGLNAHEITLVVNTVNIRDDPKEESKAA